MKGCSMNKSAGTSLVGRDFLSVSDVTAQELAMLLDTAIELKAKTKQGEPHPLLAGKTLAMIFEKPSLRTRLSFDVGMYQLGGRAFYLAPQEIGLGKRETVSDVARVVASMCDVVLARVFKHSDLVEMAEYSDKPVINALSEWEHPCQALADLLTIREHFGKIEGLKMAYIGDGNNMAHSLAFGAALSGLNLHIITPPQYWADEELISQARELSGGRSFIKASNSLESVKDADIIYTDVWASMGQETEQELRRKLFSPYQINEGIVARAKPDAIVLHCLPAHRGEEITHEVLESGKSLVFQQAENRLHAQKALLVHLLLQSYSN
jgi:ornithine carbamoyltransferase